MLKLVIIDQTDHGTIFNDFLHVELCRGRIIEEKCHKAKGVGKESFQSYEISFVKFTLLQVISRLGKYWNIIHFTDFL